MNLAGKDGPENIMEYPGAKAAFDRLVKGGADPGTLQNLLMLRTIFGDLPEHRNWSPTRRSLNSLSAKMRGLAVQIQELLRFPGVVDTIFVKAMPTINIHPGAEIFISPDHLREILMLYAQILEKIGPKERPKEATAGRNAALCRLVEYVRQVTGKKNYADLATLLNAVDSVTPSRDPRWDTTTLAQLLYRERRRSRSTE